jgi:hypothetical protein
MVEQDCGAGPALIELCLFPVEFSGWQGICHDGELREWKSECE